MASLPLSWATMPVVPDPPNGSSTTPAVDGSYLRNDATGQRPSLSNRYSAQHQICGRSGGGFPELFVSNVVIHLGHLSRSMIIGVDGRYSVFVPNNSSSCRYNSLASSTDTCLDSPSGYWIWMAETFTFFLVFDTKFSFQKCLFLQLGLCSSATH